MQAGHILLGRPWQFDREVTHDGRTNHYSFVFDKRKISLAPLSPSQVHEMQTKFTKDVETSKKFSFYLNTSEDSKSLDYSAVLQKDFKALMFVDTCTKDPPHEDILPMTLFEDLSPLDEAIGLAKEPIGVADEEETAKAEESNAEARTDEDQLEKTTKAQGKRTQAKETRTHAEKVIDLIEELTDAADEELTAEEKETDAEAEKGQDQEETTAQN